ncbi:hypothetical protein ACIO3O_19310 [Streptomyces sp. NPDC087440]|uniref:hypothetical protein n=1 Tax=Streptomyces sp. NPDC087440 TaxID=3365790 RepID=UPI003826E4CA
MNPTTPTPSPTPTEDRLRAALDARAALVTPRDLRRASPPEGRSWGLRRVRTVAYTVVGAAAAAVAVYLLVLLPGTPLDRTPVPPAHSPTVGVPTPPADRKVPPAPAPAPYPTVTGDKDPGAPARPPGLP